LPFHINNSDIDIYADDATLTSSAKWENITSINTDIQNDLDSIQKWAQSNKMMINEKKTKALLVSGKRLKKTSRKYI